MYGHAPLATAPQCEHLHQGLFNSLACHKQVPMGACKHEFASRLLSLLKEIHVDLYLSGHNHQYERLTIATGNNEHILTTLTVGLGTQLRHAVMKPDARDEMMQAYAPAEKITFTEKQYGSDRDAASINSDVIISGEQAHDSRYQELFDHGRLPAYLEGVVR